MYMEKLKNEGRYALENKELSKIKEFFDAGYADDEDTYNTIRKVYNEYGYLMDTHTAVAWKVYEDFSKKNNNGYKTVILSTASAYKFAEAVATAIGLDEGKVKVLAGAKDAATGFDYVKALEKETKVEVPYGLKNLEERPVLHTGVCESAKMADAVLEALK